MNLEEKANNYQRLHNLRENIGTLEGTLEGTVSEYNSLAKRMGEKSYLFNRRMKKTEVEALRSDITDLCVRPQSMAEIMDRLSALHNEQAIRIQVRSLIAQKRLYKSGSRGRNVKYMVRSLTIPTPTNQ